MGWLSMSASLLVISLGLVLANRTIDWKITHQDFLHHSWCMCVVYYKRNRTDCQQHHEDTLGKDFPGIGEHVVTIDEKKVCSEPEYHGKRPSALSEIVTGLTAGLIILIGLIVFWRYRTNNRRNLVATKKNVRSNDLETIVDEDELELQKTKSNTAVSIEPASESTNYVRFA